MPNASLYLVEVDAHNGTGLETLRFANGNFTSRPGDSPANVVYERLVTRLGAMERHLFSPGRTMGEGQIGFGDIELSNVQGDLDRLLNMGFDGRAVVLKRSAGQGSLASAATVLRATMTRIDAQSAYDTLRLRLYDRRLELDRTLQTNSYGGTTVSAVAFNQADGGLDLKDRVKPLVYGQVANMEPVQVNPFRLIYQVNDGAVVAITIYDGAVQLGAAGDHATLAALLAATVQPGRYATCLALGLFRLGGAPFFLVTADVTEGSPSQRTASAIVQRVLARLGLTGTANINASSFAAFAAAAPQRLGIVVGEQDRAGGVIAQVLESVGGWLIPDGQGVFTIGRFVGPVAPTWSLSEYLDDLLDDEGSIGLDANPDNDNGVPFWRTVINHSRVWRTQSPSEMGNCAVDRQAYLATEWRSAKSEMVSIKTKHLLAPELVIDTLLTTAADAQAEADRRQALYGTRRDVLRVWTRAEDAAAITPGSTGTLRLRRLGYQAGRNMVVIGRVDDWENERVQLVLWG